MVYLFLSMVWVKLSQFEQCEFKQLWITIPLLLFGSWVAQLLIAMKLTDRNIWHDDYHFLDRMLSLKPAIINRVNMKGTPVWSFFQGYVFLSKHYFYTWWFKSGFQNVLNWLDCNELWFVWMHFIYLKGDTTIQKPFVSQGWLTWDVFSLPLNGGLGWQCIDWASNHWNS